MILLFSFSVNTFLLINSWKGEKKKKKITKKLLDICGKARSRLRYRKGKKD